MLGLAMLKRLACSLVGFKVRYNGQDHAGACFKWLFIVIGFAFCVGICSNVGAASDNGKSIPQCVKCHTKVTPGIVADWKASAHAENGVVCSDCHGSEHTSKKTVNLVKFPDENACGECHTQQLEQFLRGKHSKGWLALNALPVTDLEPDELIEGARGCGGCHNMGIKPPKERERLRKMGYHYSVNSCDECHTRHLFSVKEARDPHVCQQCHMGFDHPQWEMWSSSKHGERWFAKQRGELPESAQAPTCQFCHLPDGTHENHTAWGFLGVRLPMPNDKQWAQDRVTILKALGVLDPFTGKPTGRLEAVKQLDLARLTEEAWQRERKNMLGRCQHCHSASFAKKQLEMGDAMIQKADRLMAEAINTVAELYSDGIIKKPKAYTFAYPDFLYFMRTGGGDLSKASHIDQVLLTMFLKHRMRTYQAFFHMSPDYAYWYGWAMMSKDLAKIKEMAEVLRSTRKPADRDGTDK